MNLKPLVTQIEDHTHSRYAVYKFINQKICDKINGIREKVQRQINPIGFAVEIMITKES